MNKLHLNMNLTIWLVILQLCVETVSAVATSSNVDLNPVSSSTKTSIGTTTTTLSTLSETSSKSPSTSTTISSANATASKPTQDKTIISSIPTFDFSFSKKEPEPEVVNICNTKNMCMEGFCIKGVCKTKKCSTEVYCVCNPEFTGQFCDKNMTEIELKNGKGNGNHESPPTTSSTKKGLTNENSASTQRSKESVSTNKETVNAEIATTPENNVSVSVKADTTSINKEIAKGGELTRTLGNEVLVKTVSTTISTTEDLASVKSTTTPTNKVLVNGYIDTNLIKVKGGYVFNRHFNSSKTRNGKSRIIKGTSTEDRGKRRNGDNGNGKNKNNEGNGKESVNENKRNGNTEKEKITSNGGNFDGQKEKKIKEMKNVHNKPDKESIHNTATSKNYANDLFFGKKVNSKKVTKLSSDGSYVKGPEVHVHTDRSVLSIKTPRKKIENGKPSKVNEIADVVTLSATSVEQTRLGVAPEMLTSVARESLTKKTTSKSNAKSTKKFGNVGKTKVKSTSLQNIFKEKVVSKPVASRFDIVSAANITERKHTMITEEAGSISIPNNTVTEVSPLFANSEIKITIETSNVDKNLNNDNGPQAPVTLNPLDAASSQADQNNNIARNKVNGTADRKSDPKREKVGSKSERVLKEMKLQSGPVEKTDAVTTALQKSHWKTTGASKNAEAGKSTTPEILNPIMQLMNIFRSNKFVENVSAVKIEIITNRQNSTVVEKPMSKEQNNPNKRKKTTK